MRFVKNPETGRRVARFNPKSVRIIRDVPELRIIDQALWDKVKARQSAMQARIFGEGVRIEDRRRPRYLFSGLLKCGSCGGGFFSFAEDCMAEYDLDGWKVPDLTDPGELSYHIMRK